MTAAPQRGRRPPALHPLAILALPVPAIVAVLFADGILLSLALLTVCLALSLAKGVRFASGVLGVVAGGVVLLWVGFSLAAPRAGDTSGPLVEGLAFSPTIDGAFFALRGALRMVTVVTLYIVTVAFVNGAVLGDSLIQSFGAPYRVIDVLGLGGRFSALIRSDVAAARSLARLRARGRPLRAMRLMTGLTVPVLMGAFGHADELSIAMEARGFGSEPQRTVHSARPLRWTDVIAVPMVWAITILAALALA